MHRRNLSPILGLLLSAGLAHAGPALSLPGDGAPELLRKLRDAPKVETGLRLELNEAALGLSALGRNGHLTVLARFSGPLSADDVARLEASGLRFERSKGELVAVGNIYGLAGSLESVLALTESPLVEAVALANYRGTRPTLRQNPFGKVHEKTTANRLWGKTVDGERITGDGVVITDIDGSADIFHPLFFRADAGRYHWVDENKDSAFLPGVDGVDLDGDERIDDSERLRALGGVVYEDQIPSMPSGFNPARQWLYLDINGNGRRDFGVNAGFSEDDPAYGEPLFFAEDVDGDGLLEPGEPLHRLGSSKIRGVYVPAWGQLFERGVNLINLPPNVTPQGYTDEGHGTGVGTILVGGIAERSFVQGVAPDAELIFVDQGREYDDPDTYEQSALTAMSWARDQGSRVFVHEYGQNVGEFADGSSTWEAMLDGFHDDGVAQATATHNFSGFDGHATITLAPGATVELPLDVYDSAAVGYPVYTLMGSLRWIGADGVTASLTYPDGSELSLDGDQYTDNLALWAWAETSGRGTNMIMFQTLAYEGNDYRPLPPGDWTITLSNTSEETLSVHGAVSDDTGYAYVVNMQSTGPAVELSDLGSIAHPSTADSAISVGATVGNFVHDAEVDNGLRSYSGRGPRIDGARGVDITAPSDHYAAGPSGDYDAGNYIVFGGTSGALPQVGGALALLLQAHPDLTADEIKAMVHERAGGDDLTGELPNVEWGYGRLLTHQLVLGEAAPENTPPVAAFDIHGTASTGATLELDASRSADDDGDALTYRWDLDDDGVFDVEGERVSWEPTTVGDHLLRLEVEDAHGARHGAIQTFGIGPAEPHGEDPTEGDDDELRDDFLEDPIGGVFGCAAASHSDHAGLGALLLGLLAQRRRRRER